MTVEGVEMTTVKEVQEQFFLEVLPSREGCYYYRAAGLKAEPGTIVLFQCDNRIIASAAFERLERRGGKLYFDVSSIKVFDPVGPDLLREVWPEKFENFSQVKQSLNAKAFPKFERRLTGIRVPKLALPYPTFDTAQELIQPGEVSLFILTDGRNFNIKPDGSGSTGFWRISPTRHRDRVVVYRAKPRNGRHFAELFTARYDGVVGPTEHDKYTVKLLDVKLAGTTYRRWQEFTGIGQTPHKYFSGVAVTPTHDLFVVDEDEESAFPEGAEKYRMHWARERDPEIARKAKCKRLSETGKLKCEACNFDYSEKYGDRGVGFIEAHHMIPVSQLNGKTKTRIKDLALVCSNCHRMLHRGPPLLSVAELKALLQDRE